MPPMNATTHRDPVLTLAKLLLATSVGVFCFASSLVLLPGLTALLAQPRERAPGVPPDRIAYDPSAPCYYDESSSVFWYHGIPGAARFDEQDQPIPPTVAELGLCDKEPAACPPPTADEPAPEFIYAPGEPNVYDEATGIYWYHGIPGAVRFDDDDQPVFPTVAELGLCEQESEVCLGPTAEPQPIGGYDPALPVFFDEETGIYWCQGVPGAPRFDENELPIPPTLAELGIAEAVAAAADQPSAE